MEHLGVNELSKLDLIALRHEIGVTPEVKEMVSFELGRRAMQMSREDSDYEAYLDSVEV